MAYNLIKKLKPFCLILLDVYWIALWLYFIETENTPLRILESSESYLPLWPLVKAWDIFDKETFIINII
jgi:hypothetical protein